MGVVDKIIPISRGEYDATATYYKLDYVRYSNCTWIAKKQCKGQTPPASPSGQSDFWALLSQDGAYTGQFPTWSDIRTKPFETIDGNSFEVDSSKKLKVKFPTITWGAVISKPFERISSLFTNTNGELDLKIDGITIQRDALGRLSANVASSGFDIHGLPNENVISTNDEFTFYDASAAGMKKTMWSNIVSKLSALFSKIYDRNGDVITTTTLKDTTDEVNDNSAQGQIAGALAVKTIFQSIAPKPESAPAFSTTKSYDLGEVVSRNGEIYYCVVPVTKSGVWNDLNWTKWESNMPIRFGVDKDGNYGFIKVGADSVTPFSRGGGSKSFAYVLGAGAGNYNIKDACEQIKITYKVDIDYTTLSNSNFCVSSGSGTASAHGTSPNYSQGSYELYNTASASCSPATWSYSPSNGNLAVYGGSIYASGDASCGGARKVVSGSKGVGAGTVVMFVGFNQ